MSTIFAPGTPAGAPADAPAPAAAPAPTDVVVVEAISGIYRVARRGETVGYVQETGQRFVSLLGAVYNTSVEVAQTLSLDAAVRRLLSA